MRPPDPRDEQCDSGIDAVCGESKDRDLSGYERSSILDWILDGSEKEEKSETADSE